MTKPFYSLKNNCAAIEISGEEVGSFLNDILTAELNLLPVGKNADVLPSLTSG